jgi:hypothetical protein
MREIIEELRKDPSKGVIKTFEEVVKELGRKKTKEYGRGTSTTWIIRWSGKPFIQLVFDQFGLKSVDIAFSLPNKELGRFEKWLENTEFKGRVWASGEVSRVIFDRKIYVDEEGLALVEEELRERIKQVGEYIEPWECFKDLKMAVYDCTYWGINDKHPTIEYMIFLENTPGIYPPPRLERSVWPL